MALQYNDKWQRIQWLGRCESKGFGQYSIQEETIKEKMKLYITDSEKSSLILQC